MTILLVSNLETNLFPLESWGMAEFVKASAFIEIQVQISAHKIS
jgi:hypothetical protein